MTRNVVRKGVRVFAMVLLAAGSACFAQSWPAKSIRVIVPFPPGGGTDIIARVVANKLAETPGWNVLVENKPGAGGNLGVDAAAKAPADGYTIVLGQTSNLAINPSLYARLPYDPVKDLKPIVLVADAALAIVVAQEAPFKSLADLVTAAKAKPGTVNFASPGNGTVAHLSGEVFQKAAGVRFQHVPYKGANQALTDLIGGQVQFYMSSIPTVLGQIKAGKLRALAVSSPKRVVDLPSVPTVAEAGYKGFDTSTWFGFLAPAATPAPVIATLNGEINRVLKLVDVQKKIESEGASVLGGTAERFAAFLKDDLVRWSRVVKESGAKLD